MTASELQRNAHVLVLQEMRDRFIEAGIPSRTSALDEAIAALAVRPAVAQSFQADVAAWMGQCFLPSLSSNMTERGDRLLEEVLELLQANGYDSARVPTLVNYVFGRPVGEPAQEVGGVMVTLAAYCSVAGLSMQADGQAELDRINQPEVMARIRAKQEAKNALHFDTPLPGAAAQSSPAGQGEKCDLHTSEGGRRYVADFFARELRRHDFGRYITNTLAADFACALAQHLAARQPVEFERAVPTRRRESAVELLLSLGFVWNNQRWEDRRQPVGVPVAWMTHHDEPMLFPTATEAAAYCEDDEQPVPLFRSPAQAVDLAPVRAALDAAEGLAAVCASVDGYSREEVAASGRAMRQQFADARAMIDSQAVRNG